MTAILFLARHADHAEVGHVLSGRSEIALSDAGCAQADVLARLCRRRGVRAIQSSPRRRTMQTAAIIAARLETVADPVDALDEIDFGRWSGRPFAELDADPDWREWNTRRATAVTDGGETMAEAAARIIGHLADIARSGDSHVLCVSHCDMIKAAVAHYLGLSLDNILRFAIDPASLTTLAIGAGGGELIRLNETIA
jgi:broad specificity phosphatase PhoE